MASRHIARPRLTAMLWDGLATGSILVTGIRGSGKTMLLAEWYRLCALPEGDCCPVWLALRSEDADPACFWKYLTYALSRIIPDLEKEMLEISNFSKDLSKDFEDTLVNALYNLTDQSINYILFLDNVEFISNQIMTVFEHLIADLPVNVHLVMAGLYLEPCTTTLHFYDSLFEIDDSILSFSLDETQNYLGQTIQEGFNQKDLLWLQTVCKGWITGIKLAAPLLASKRISNDFSSMSLLSHQMESFFSTQVINNLPRESEEFLLECSFLERMSASLCDYMTNFSHSALIISDLANKNFFISECLDGSDWYEIHPLFRAWLINRALSLHLNRVREITYRASEWFERNNMDTMAAKYMILAGDHELLEQLSASTSIICTPGSPSIYSWLLRNNAEDINNSPLLALLASWAYLICGRPKESRQWLTIFENTLEKASQNKDAIILECGQSYSAFNREAIDFSITCIRLKCDSMEGKHSKTILRVKEFLETNEKQMSMSIQCVFVHALGESYERIGKLEDAQECYLQAEAIGALAGSLFYVFFNRYLYGILQLLSGKFQSVQDLCYQSFKECPEDSSPYGALCCLLARAQLEMGLIDAAEKNLRRATRRLSLIRNKDILIETYIADAQLLVAREELDDAYEKIVQTALISENNMVLRGVACPVYFAQAHIALLRNNLTDARVAEKKLSAIVSPDDLVNVLAVRTIRARLLFAAGEFETAHSKFHEIAQEALNEHLLLLALEPLIFDAASLQRMGMRGQALSKLAEALQLGISNGFFTTFVEYRSVLKPLIREMLTGHKVSAELRNFAKRLELANVQRDYLRNSNLSVPNRELSSLEQRLTKRELEILRLLSSGMTRADIAEFLNISINTSKTHVNNIFMKLEVSSVQQIFELFG